jgi:nitrite reductase/ring-hydroxylating ferredoxin subunit
MIGNLNVAAQFRDYVSAGDVDEVERITSGTGAIVLDGLKKLAVYRDIGGRVHTYSPNCPHLGCLLPLAWIAIRLIRKNS